MGIGSISLGIVSCLLVLAGMVLRSPHEVVSLGLVIALSGAAIAHEARRSEPGTSPSQKRVGFWLNAGALIVGAVSIAIEILRHRIG
jgi:hypothetical protein